MASKRRKDALFQAISVMGKAFASPVRLVLLDLLAQAPRTVDGLAGATGQSNANISQHLQALHAANRIAFIVKNCAIDRRNTNLIAIILHARDYA